MFGDGAVLGLTDDHIVQPHVFPGSSWRRLDEEPDTNRIIKISNISCIKSQNLNDSCLIFQLSLANPLKPGVKLRMKM